MRKRLREGMLDDKEIEVERGRGAARARDLGPPGMEEMAEQLQGHVRQDRRRASARARKLKIGEARSC